MRVGVFYFPTDYGIDIAELARALEERGFGSLYVSEHTHIPTGRAFPCGGMIRKEAPCPSPPRAAEREGPAAQRWEGEVAVSSLRSCAATHLTPTLSPRKRGEREEPAR
jgi:hypothetical protein